MTNKSVDRTAANINWYVANEDGTLPTWERIGIAVLMDIRRELQRLNALLSCPNFTGIPTTLQAIYRNTAKPRARRKR
jgi:hypothetical protein